MQYNTHYSFDVFNELLSIDDATDILRSKNLLKKNLEHFGQIFVKHNVQKEWGLVLLHRHFIIQSDEIPITEIIQQGNEVEYKTEPKKSNFNEPYWPSIFSFNAKDGYLMQPVEFTTDKLTKENNEILEQKGDFLLEIKNELSLRSLQNTFGIISTRKNIGNDYRYVEFNFDDRVSILKIKRFDDVKEMNLGETSWYFELGVKAATCTYCPLDANMRHTGPSTRYH